MRSPAAFLLVALAVTAAAARAADAVPTRDCASRGDPSDGSAIRFVSSGDVVVGPISFAGLAAAASATRLDRGPDGRFGRKVAAKVLWGNAVTVSVAPASRPALALAYARTDALSDAVRFEPCPPGTRMFGGNGRLRRVTAFPGGFSFSRRGCFTLEVRVDRGRQYRRTVGLGAGSCRKGLPETGERPRIGSCRATWSRGTSGRSATTTCSPPPRSRAS